MWITRTETFVACALSMVGCAHRAAELTTPTQATALRALAANAVQELERTGVDAFDADVAALQASGDPIDAVAAELLVDLVTHVQHDEEMRGPIVVAFVEPRTPALHVLTDAIEIGLRKHTGFRVSDRRAFDAVGDEQRREYGGRFDDASLQPIGAHLGAHAFGRVAIDRIGTRSVISARITSMRTLLVLADARVTTDTLLPADATTDAVRKALLTARRIRESLEDRSGRPRICERDPTIRGCP